MGWTRVNSMLNFSRLSRRTHRIVNARISCEYSFIPYSDRSLRALMRLRFRLVVFDGPSGVRDKHVIQPRPMIIDELQLTGQTIRGFKNCGQGLLRRIDPNVQPSGVVVTARMAGRFFTAAANFPLARVPARSGIPGHRPGRPLIRWGPRALILPMMDRDPIAQLIGFIQIVGGHDHRDTSFTHRSHVVPNAQLALHIQPQCRLVQEQNLGIGQQSTGDVQFSLHPAGIGLGGSVGLLFQFNQFQQLGRCVSPRPRETSGRGQPVTQMLPSGEKPIDGPLLRNIPDGLSHAIGIVTESNLKMRAEPEVGLSRVIRMRRVVLLPAPFGPSRPKISRYRPGNDRSSTARTLS